MSEAQEDELSGAGFEEPVRVVVTCRQHGLICEVSRTGRGVILHRDTGAECDDCAYWIVRDHGGDRDNALGWLIEQLMADEAEAGR